MTENIFYRLAIQDHKILVAPTVGRSRNIPMLNIVHVARYTTVG